MIKGICEKHHFVRVCRLIAISCVCLLILAGCATSQHSRSSKTVDPNDELEAAWGVRMESIRLTAAGHLVDFRYRVVDPEKALTLMKRGGEAFLIDEATGTRLPVPVTKVGQLRGTGTMPQDDRVYTVMFNSGGGLIQPGSKVSVVIGDFKAEHLIVE